MDMMAKAILTAKSTSFQFEDRIIPLSHSPVKIGRSHKEDRPEAENAFFDCKVLSRGHAVLSYEDGRFFIQDAGSSNGTFINNIRLSKTGEESKLTQIYAGDILRFGSDVVDKAKNVTQRAIVSKVKLLYPDGTESVLRPPESKLYRPTESFDEVNLMNQNLEESFNRERALEDRLLKVRGLISKHIGRSQSDMIRIYEDIKEELMKPYEAAPPPPATKNGTTSSGETDSFEMDRILGENRELGLRLSDIENKLADRENFCLSVQRKQGEDVVEIAKLRHLIDKQNGDIADLEGALTDTQRELDTIQSGGDKESQLKAFYEAKIFDISAKAETDLEVQRAELETQIRAVEDGFSEERSRIRNQLQEVTSNEINLLERIKSLESEKGYARAEVEKIVVKEADSFEHKQELEYKVECLSVELADARERLEEAKSAVVVERSAEDIQTISDQEAKMNSLREEVSYIKKELIGARSGKAAAEDDLNTVKGTVETLNNTVNALTTEDEASKEKIKLLEENLAERTRERDHLHQLLTEMEGQLGQDEKTKVQINDLRTELAAAQTEVKSRIDEIFGVKDLLRLEKETVQQRDIEIAKLNGQVQFVEEEKEILKSRSGDVDSLQAEINQLRNRLNLVVEELEVTREDNTTLSRELEQQHVLYMELKKMRGMGEEMDMLRQAQTDVVIARERGEEAMRMFTEAKQEMGRMEAERIRLLREVAQLKSGKGDTTDSVAATAAGVQDLQKEAAATPSQAAADPAAAKQQSSTTKGVGADTMMFEMGSLKLYEILLGMVFISVILSWNPYTLPL